MHIIREGLIWFFDVIGLSKLYAWYVGRSKSRIRIVAFHEVHDGTWFKEMILALKSRYHFITPEDLTTQNFNPKRINLLVTFDDGYASWYEVVLPILKECNVKALFFLCSGIPTSAALGTSDSFMREHLKITPKAPLTWEMAQKLLASGHTIGGHTKTHLSLSTCMPKTQMEEICEDKERTEKKLKVTLEHFAYPFGTKKDMDRITEQNVRASGYTYVYSAIPGWYTKGESPIPRTLLERGQSVPSVIRWIEGGYDIFARFKSMIYVWH